jgi:hypothetical protein
MLNDFYICLLSCVSVNFLNYVMNSDFLILVLNDFVFIVIAMNDYE